MSVTDTEYQLIDKVNPMRSIDKSEPDTKKRPEGLFGAGDQTWTDTDVTPQDFKSCASADSATPAY